MTNQVSESKAEILIVDDKLENLRLLSIILLQHDYEVRKALNGKMALKSVKSDPPDLILLDINMPDLNGYEVCQHLKANDLTNQIPVIFLSALDQGIDKVRAFAVGAADYISKPFAIEEVLARIEYQLTIQRQRLELIEKNRILQEEIRKREKAELALIQVNQKLQRLAVLDSLTQLANRRRFDEYLNHQWQQLFREKIANKGKTETIISLILCDVDYFKLYNDNYGHLEGDICLQQVALVIRNTIKRSGDLAARYGGEEFAAILPHTNTEGAIHIAKKMQLKLQQLKIPHGFSPVSNYVTLSIGIASQIPSQSTKSSQLIALADAALYRAKAKGRNCIVCIK
jgi:diguanylate cyclase (GGDEF)-like protein